MFSIRRPRPGEAARAIEIWRDAVDATHDFLTTEDRIAIDTLVCGLLPHAPLWMAVDPNDRPIAFMLLDRGHVEAIFVDPAMRGSGAGAALVRHGLGLHPTLTTDANEQNHQAVDFYEGWVSPASDVRPTMRRAGLTRSSAWLIKPIAAGFAHHQPSAGQRHALAPVVCPIYARR